MYFPPTIHPYKYPGSGNTAVAKRYFRDEVKLKFLTCSTVLLVSLYAGMETVMHRSEKNKLKVPRLELHADI